MATSFLLSNTHLLKGVKPFKKRMKEQGTKVIQQSDYLKDFMLKIQKEGLNAAYLEYGDCPPGPSPPTIGASQEYVPPKDVEYDVIIVGAGMAGLAAAYELKRVGLKVKILEQTDRYGGRVFTYGEDAGLAPGLFGEAGAMRLPGGVGAPNDRAHFLTDGYVTDFQISIKKFPNFDENGISNIYGLKEKTATWEKNHFDTVWPNWRKGIKTGCKKKGKKDVVINNIDDYYSKTTGVVTDQLIAWLNKTTTIDEEIAVWDRWIDIWSQFTLESFLESNVKVILAKLESEDEDGCDNLDSLDVDMLENLLPWSDDAVRGYSVFSYTEQLDQSLVQYLRDQLGNWWSRDMHTLVGGMHSLAEAFFSSKRSKPLISDDLKHNQQVCKISYFSSPCDPSKDCVIVTCYASGKDPETTYKARAVMLTTQVNILRQITFEPIQANTKDNEALRKNLQAIEDMFTGPATKIILQTKTRFWEDEKYAIKGGFSKTNLPIGQIHYVKPDPGYLASTKQGIILIYTWKNEALLFGSLTKDQAKKEAIEQVAEIHPEIEGAVEKCIVHAWYNQPSYQGAYGLLKTTQFNNIRYLWEPMGNVHFASDNISFTAGWIQGALESGFKSAYQVYARHMKRVKLGKEEKIN
ncbi:L-amino-acid oxidase-like [Dendronephthya gigantea]|uniref:L-amino-acid oxidase-like n=1 Tax=Dendronephthya gigantea TaxID=151771 RepID=UPI00106D4B21|nr:L-amino-acid oxidase-like [Dendronephthya gigantea]XP_028414024.1 L-amino-acid oxidase-like [Dendronephthya gigantea]